MFRTDFNAFWFKSTTIRLFNAGLLLFTPFFLVNCQKEIKDPVVSKRQALEKFAAANPESAVFWIDSAQSEVNWYGSLINGTPFSGKLLAAGGCLVETEGGITGGYLQLPLDWISVEHKDSTISLSETKALLVSPEVLNAKQHPLVDFEIKTATRHIERGDILAGSNQLGLTHQLVGNLILNDSTQQVSFPVKVDTLAEGQRMVAGKFSLMYSEYGIRYGTLQDSTARYKANPQIDLEFKLRFKRLRLQ